MGIHFNHITKNQPIFRNDIVPGRVDAGINGRQGKEGVNGATIHFSDYTPTNDYVKEIMLEKIKNNVTLSSQNETTIEKIKYRDGDIIVTNEFFVYRLAVENEEYSFTFMGKVINRSEDSSELPDEDTLKNNIIGVKFTITEEKLFNIPVPSNRCMDASVGLSLYGYNYTYYPSIGDDIEKYPTNNEQPFDYQKAYKKTIGFNMKPTIEVSSVDLVDNWDFYLKIYLKNRKSPQSSSYILDEMKREWFSDPSPRNVQGFFEFHKYAEIKLNAVCGSSYQDSSIEPKSTYNITDMSCDKLHPSNNGINSNYVTANIPIKTSDNGLIMLGGIDYPESSPAVSIREYFNSYERYDSSKNDFIEKEQEIFCKEKYYPSKSDLGYLSTIGMAQFSINNMYNINFRSGDSAYFSAMCKNYGKSGFDIENNNNDFCNKVVEETDTENLYVSYSNFVKNTRLLNYNFALWGMENSSLDSSVYTGIREDITKNYVVPIIKSFFLNSQNIYELTCVNRKTGLTKKMYTNVKIE